MQAKTALVIAEGVVAGLLAHLAIAVVLLIGDLVSGHPALFTPALLGGALLEGTREACQAPLRATTLLAYASIHLLALTAFGLLASYLMRSSEERPFLWFGALLTFVVVAWHLEAAVLFLLGPVRGCISLWWIVGASFAGALAMARYLWRAHPRLRERLRTDQYA
jgi:hypothetical protein